MLQCVVMCCSVLRFTTGCCSALRSVPSGGYVVSDTLVVPLWTPSYIPGCTGRLPCSAEGLSRDVAGNTQLRNTQHTATRNVVASNGSLDTMCCSVSQCVAVCRSVLQCVAVCCSVSQCVAVCYSVSQCVAVWCSEVH